MKILKIFGIVAGIHVFALVLIFANPGCSSSTKTPPRRSDTLPPSSAATAATTEPALAPAPSSSPSSIGTPPSISFNPDAPAVAGPGGRFSPTRPNTPAAGALVTEPVGDVTPATTYTIKSGDTLSGIAKRHHITIAELRAANNIREDTKLQPGRKLLIPGKQGSTSSAAASAPAPTATKSPNGTASHTAAAPAPSARPSGGLKHIVKSNETLGSIARHYGVKQSDLAVANNIADPGKLRMGTELIIPGWDAAGGKTSKAKGSSTASSSRPAQTGEPPAEQPADPATANQPAPPVPVIRIEDSPLTPAPRP